MEDDQQQRINEAAAQFADAVKVSYQAVAKRGEEGQELNAELTQQFFNRVNEHLRTHAEENRQLTQELADQQQRRQEAGQQIAQESVGAYMDFMNSMFSFSQGAAQGRPDSDTAAPTGPDTGGGRGRSDPSVSPRTEPTSTTPGREPGGGEPGGEEEGKEDKGMLKKAKDALTGEDKPRSEEPREPRRDDPPSGRS